MSTWASTTHTIADIKEWADEGKLIIQPAYQRNTVWNLAAKIMLIDSIINDIPIPKIFIAKTLNEKKPVRRIIDGQQRITSILEFLAGEIKLQSPYRGDFANLTFNELPNSVQEAILQYDIDINEITNPTEEQEREVYSRINKYSVPLNSQELRQAEFPGDFLELAKEIAANDFWNKYRFFTPVSIRRNKDVEFISETLILLIDGIQDKKTMLDDYYYKYLKMGKLKEQIKSRYLKLLTEISILFDNIFQYDGDLLYDYEVDGYKSIKKTRFSQQADFYSLLYAINSLFQNNGSLLNKNISTLVKDFIFLEKNIAPESNISILKNYAVKCISQANSASSRKWRGELLKNIINGTLKVEPISKEYIKIAYSIIEDCEINYTQYGCPFSIVESENMGDEFYFNEAKFAGWKKTNEFFQISNLEVFKEEPPKKYFLYCSIENN